MNPVIKYRGGKSRDLDKFIKYIPAAYDRYIEPFLGGGALFFFLEPRKAILNDRNKKLINFYKQLRDEYPAIRAELDALREIYERNQRKFRKMKSERPGERAINENEKLYYRMRDIFNHPTTEFLEGSVYFFINKTAYSGMIRYNRRGEYNVPFGRYENFNSGLATEAHSRLLRSSRIYNSDYSEIFNKARSADFIFLDPPYDCVFNDYGDAEFNEDEHRRLFGDFKNLACRALMVIGKTSLTTELYKNFICDEYHKRYAVNIRNRFKNESAHIVIKNY